MSDSRYFLLFVDGHRSGLRIYAGVRSLRVFEIQTAGLGDAGSQK